MACSFARAKVCDESLSPKQQMPDMTRLRVCAELPVPNVLDDLPTESLSSISKRLVPAEVKEAVQEAPAIAKDVAEQAADALPQ